MKFFVEIVFNYIFALWLGSTLVDAYIAWEPFYAKELGFFDYYQRSCIIIIIFNLFAFSYTFVLIDVVAISLSSIIIMQMIYLLKDFEWIRKTSDYKLQVALIDIWFALLVRYLLFFFAVAFVIFIVLLVIFSLDVFLLNFFDFSRNLNLLVGISIFGYLVIIFNFFNLIDWFAVDMIFSYMCFMLLNIILGWILTFMIICLILFIFILLNSFSNYKFFNILKVIFKNKIKPMVIGKAISHEGSLHREALFKREMDEKEGRPSCLTYLTDTYGFYDKPCLDEDRNNIKASHEIPSINKLLTQWARQRQSINMLSTPTQALQKENNSLFSFDELYVESIGKIIKVNPFLLIKNKWNIYLR